MKSETLLAFGGCIFGLVSAWFLYVGFSAEVTVATAEGQVANLQLMHIQATNISIGVGSGLASIILWAACAIVCAINDR